jgi:peptide/nickel transport system ATP-binding protein
LSGGMAQRGMIAMAASCKPDLIIADEPTSSLDTVTQASIISLLLELNRDYGIAIIFITHDIGLALSFSNRIVVLNNGSIEEEGMPKKILYNSNNSYTKRLLKPFIIQQKSKIKNDKFLKGNGIDSLPILEIKKINKTFENRTVGFKRRKILLKAVDELSLLIHQGESLGLLGESGCGKSTLARLIVRLLMPNEGDILIKDSNEKSKKNCPKQVQMVFQNPLSSMDPNMRVGDIIAEGVDILKVCYKQKRTKLIIEYLNKVGLDESFIKRYPHELSGGQRQRVCIARALIMNPKLLICDEPTSYLDVVAQDQIIELLTSIKEEANMAMLFISHNISVLRQVSDRIAVMCYGKIVEIGDCEDIVNNPMHPYTKLFTSAIKANSGEIKLQDYFIGDTQEKSENKTKTGCPFCNRCVEVKEICRNEVPELLKVGNSHEVACHQIKVPH